MKTKVFFLPSDSILQYGLNMFSDLSIPLTTEVKLVNCPHYTQVILMQYMIFKWDRHAEKHTLKGEEKKE